MKSAVVAVVGDIMLDEYIIGETSRISPEAPEPIITEYSREYVPGGAANVAVNINALGAHARLYGIVGDDADSRMLRKALAEKGVSDEWLIEMDGRPTTRKTRMISRGNQVLRVDHEVTENLDERTAQTITAKIIADNPDIIVISDYAKGMITPDLVSLLVDSEILVLVDPKSKDFAKYHGAFVLTPNHSEFLGAAGINDDSIDTIGGHAQRMMNDAEIDNLLVTLGPRGMMLIEGDGKLTHIHSAAREVYDVTGAGDTVIGSMACSLAAGASLEDASRLANSAAGVVVGKHKTAVAKPHEILAASFGIPVSMKIMERSEMRERAEELKKKGKTIVFTNGCFDLLHIGHITYLNMARALGDLLIVGLNTDRSVQVNKGEGRPIISEIERSRVLAALESVDYVVLFDEETPFDIIDEIKPDILVKGADYEGRLVVGRDIVEASGGRVELLPFIEGNSTSSIIEKIKGLTE
jgi:D-beta-D-heptose 7-phosphate kinase/D-beta-D-heptose 1-phosphate adenosyltransferase